METLKAQSRKALLIRVAGLAVAFVQLSVLTRTLPASDFGIVAYCLAWQAVLGVPGLLGADLGAVKQVAAMLAEDFRTSISGFLSHARRRIWISSIVTSTVFLLASSAAYSNRRPNLAIASGLIAASTPIYCQLRLSEAFLRGFHRIAASLTPYLLMTPALFLTIYIVSIEILRQGHTARTAIIAYGGALAVALMLVRGKLAHVLSARTQRQQNHLSEDYRDWNRSSGLMSVYAGFSLMFDQTGVIMVGLLLGPSSAGAYAVATRISTVLAIFLAALNAALAPRIAHHHQRKTMSEMQRELARGIRTVGFVTIAAWAGLVVFGRPILGFFDPAFPDLAYWPMIILASGQLFSVMVGPVALLLNMTGHEKATARTLGLVSVANVVGNLILIPEFGLAGAAFSTFGSIILWNLGLAQFVFRRLQVKVSFLGQRTTQ